MSSISGTSFSLGSLPASALRIKSASNTQTNSSTPAADATNDLRAAANAIVTALGQFSVTPTTTSPVYARSSLPAAINGRIARLSGVHGSASTLQATQAINTQVSTVRSSTQPLGLDLSPARVSQLRSAVLGLDVTTADAPSILRSARGLGLDVTSPAAASLLASSAALGLDLTSPNAASTLASARALGLDLTSPETASKLYSAALGLRLTAPNAASKLRSALALGLDITSPETASVLSSSGMLGLDVTSPAGPSRLSSSGSLHLDVSSPSAASLLRSAETLGLDVSSPDAASKLTSSSRIGLDIASPERGSTLASTALGLDLTSPNAASKLSSSTAMGLDVTSPQTASALKSSAVLGLDVATTQTASTITSTGELNTGVTTSYGSSTLTFPSSTSTGTLTGAYTGVNTAANATSLDFKITAAANLNFLLPSAVKFEVRDQSNNVLFSYNGSLRSGDTVYLGDDIGLTVAFGSGSLANGQSASTTVTKTPISVDGNATFNNATSSLRPKFDGGGTVTAGSFSVNGTTIAVNANDSVNSVLARINASAAGVTATMNGDKVTLTTNAASEDSIVIGGDTSGFVAATKLASATTTKGNIRDDSQVLAKTTQFASVSTGSFTVNGATIAVNRIIDTVQSVVGKINASAAGVTASYDSAQDKLLLTTNTPSEDQVVVTSDTTGFLSASKLATANTVRGNIRDDQQILTKTAQFGAVATGSFTINGVSIAVNKDADSLSSVISRINGAGAGVVAAYNTTLDKLVLTGTTNSEDLIAVESDTSGFLTAAKLATSNAIRGHLSEDTVAFKNLSRFAGVGTGSFIVDGATINVAATDTIQSVVSKINASGARVTATFDSAANRLQLATTYVTEDAVPVGTDTSGFLSAAGIASANTVVGNIHDDRQTLAKTSAFAGVSNGSFTINGVAIAVDKDVDTLAAVVTRINNSAAGVTAVYAADSDTLTLTSNTNGEDLIAVGDSGTGLVNALKLATANTARGHLTEDGVALYDLVGFFGVTNGTFSIDGKTVAVSTGDSINSIVGKINSSGARVIASYDRANDKLALQATYNSEDALPIGSDTSGFLAAAHLEPANTVLGNLPDDTQVLANTSQFGGVASGSFTINGATIAVDRHADSLSSIIGKINASAAGVTASYDAATNAIDLVGNANSEDAITVANDNTNFLTAAKLDSGNTVRGNLRDDQQVLAKTSQFAVVTNGAFAINGVAIAVDTNADTLTSVIDRINTAGAGVRATYDASHDRIALTSTSNTEDQIVVGDDSSGFLSAAKLATENTVRGNIRDDRQLLAKTSQFSGVSSGSFSINGVSIALDSATDTLASVIDRINGADAGVGASYDNVNDRLLLTGTNDSEDLIHVDNDSTGFLDAAHLATASTERGHLPEDTVVLSDLPRFQSVTNGAFVVDGHSIAVDADTDTIQSIVGKINTSGARVVANYDPTSDRIALNGIYDSEDALPIGDDTSGFLSAAGIDSTDTIKGNIRDDRQLLAKTSQFGGVSSGSFSINGATIAVDADSDTLNSVIDRINRADAGVVASYDAAHDTVLLTATANSEDLIDVGDDSSGFLAAAGLSTANTVRGHLPEDAVALRDIAAFATARNGFFAVDGRTIAIDTAIDSVASIVDKINTSGARVVAAYDGATDKLTLRATYDSEDDVPVGGDTSGFLSAAHLDASNTAKGNIADDIQVLSKTSQFGGVTSGSFGINGATINVDAESDTLQSIIAKINASAAGVIAAFDPTTNRIALTGTSNGEEAIVVSNDSTGFVASAYLDTANTARGNVRDDRQRLSKTSQFAAVTDGAFTINGITIAVDASADSLATVVDKINNADAGVSATYDSATDRVVLTNGSPSEDVVQIGNDTSGFLAAAGIDSANTERGNIPDDQQVLAKTAQFAGVINGSFNVNGRSITVDTRADTLGVIIARINAAGAGVTAWYDIASDTLTFTPIPADAPVQLDGDTSGFFAAAHVPSGTAGTRVNVDASFNAAGLASPLFDPGRSVHAGSFAVNGVNIDVAADDSVRSVLAKISVSSAGVSAAFDDATQSVELTAKNLAAAPISLGADSSGFLNAVKLDANARSSAGTDPTAAANALLADMPEYSHVHAGTLTVNGTQIHIDPASITIASLIDRLNHVDGVVASLDDVTGRVSLSAKPRTSALRIVDGTGVLASLGISAGGPRRIITPTQTKDQTNAESVAAQVAAGANAIDAAVARYAIDGASAKAALEGAASVLTASGLKGVSVSSGSVVPQLTVDQNALVESLSANGRAFVNQFAQNGGFAAAVESLFDRFTAAASATAHAPTTQLTDAVKASFLSSDG